MAKNKDGVYRAPHNDLLKQAICFYLNMCSFADFDKQKLISFLYCALITSSIDEKVKIINPRRFSIPVNVLAIEKRLYHLFLAYCLMDLCSAESKEFDASYQYVIKNSCENFGSLPQLQDFYSFIKETFFPIFDEKIHMSKGFKILSTTGKTKRAVNKPLNSTYPLPVIDNYAPFNIPPQKRK